MRCCHKLVIAHDFRSVQDDKRYLIEGHAWRMRWLEEAEKVIQLRPTFLLVKK